MIARLRLALILILSQTVCASEVEEGVGFNKPVELTSQLRQGLERSKREFLQLEDLTVGDGPLAAWGRKISTDIEARYTGGTHLYPGSAIAYQRAHPQ